ncbi:hypothetical protein [Bradyrhizobium sp. STM 3557]|uniref:hypothetical protein n=1 Tax=Bradyrhizobium sp. STM 3557 TaxID=578920 RepID=UPI00388D362F
MSDSLTITAQINLRWQIAAHDAEIIARSQDAVARSKTLLQDDPPNTFVGKRQLAEPREE